MSLIVCEAISRTYKLGKVNVPALKEVSFSINSGEFLLITGPSGSGKTSLLNILGLIDSPNEGTMKLDGKVVHWAKEKQLTLLRRDYIGFIFQSYNLIPILTVLENVEYPLLYSSMPTYERHKKAYKLLKEIGISELANRYPNELSGGQQQRAAIARALIRSPRIILADEPTANLDSKTSNTIIELLNRINQQDNVTIILSTHNEKLASYTDRHLLILDGILSNTTNLLKDTAH